MNDLGYESFDAKDLEYAYQALDIDNDGVITYDEFRVWFLNGQKNF